MSDGLSPEVVSFITDASSRLGALEAGQAASAAQAARDREEMRADIRDVKQDVETIGRKIDDMLSRMEGGKIVIISLWGLGASAVAVIGYVTGVWSWVQAALSHK